MSDDLDKKLQEWTKMPAKLQAIEDTKNYLDRGRRFENLDDEKLPTEWVTAFRKWLEAGGAAELTASIWMT